MVWRRVRNRREDSTEPGDPLVRARERMVAEQIEARGLTDPDLLRAFRAVPRHRFVDSAEPYADEALPLPAGQTISQPYVVALMTDAARPPGGWRGAKVLEIGTGSGYQAAILAELGAEVISVERHAELSEEAGRRLADAGYEAVLLVVGDGTKGWPAGAPYDAIIVTAAGPSVPQPLLQQLSEEGGRLAMPVGERRHQQLNVVERRGSELISSRRDPVVFVPLIGEYGFGE
ncbi:MAG: protein-L-isoaspartate(D-aspartate) O-methyltransferase [Chloroflexota bacterium]|nr:protein-L-isoaspartate(D-aspartate) O-methyltransferase [Chloroflexota bacterium]